MIWLIVLIVTNVATMIYLRHVIAARNRWKYAHSHAMVMAEGYAARWREVDQREARFRQALGYYADEETWCAPGRSHSPAFRDRGERAREALEAARKILEEGK